MRNAYNLFFPILFFTAFTFTSCGEDKPAQNTGNTFTEDMVKGADGGLDSLQLSPDSTETSDADTVQTQL